MDSESPVHCPKCRKALHEPGNFCPACGEDLRGLTPTADTLSGPWVDRVVDGRYRLLEKLGEGGMGAVYKVEHVRMGKVLALKVLRPDLAIDKRMKARFQQEARVVSRLGHPNTISVFDYGELDDGSLFLAMEFLAGRDLAWLLRAHGPFSEERATRVGLQVLSSLGEAHELGIVHRDIKPANVMLLRRRDGGETVKVLDFGIAKLVDGEGRKHITGTDFVGTPQYMSPEQGKGEPLDARSDLYSVAAMLFELVTGKGLFDAPTAMGIVSKHMTEPPPRIAQVAPDRMVSPGFEAVLRRALAKDPADRFPSAEAMRVALERARQDLPATFGDITPAAQYATGEVASREDFDAFERSLRMRRIVAPVVTLMMLVSAGAGAWWFLTKGERTGTAVYTEEREPNGEPQTATRIPLGEPVRGMIGAAQSESQSDLDVYRLELPSEGALSVSVTGVPDMNLVVGVFGADGALLASLDDGRVAQGERVDGLRVAEGPLYLRVQERRHPTEPARPPRETTQHSYTLLVERAEDEDGRLEREPENDRLDSVVESFSGKAVRGFTGIPLRPDVETFEQPLSSVDLFRIAAVPGGGRVWAIVVPPEGGRLAVADEHRVDTWRKRENPNVRNAGLPSFVEAHGGAPVLVALEEGRLGHAVRVFPLVGTGTAPVRAQVAEPGSAYFVAFLVDRGEGSLEGVLDLLTVLGERGREDARGRVTELVRGALKGSPLLAQFTSRVETSASGQAGQASAGPE